MKYIDSKSILINNSITLYNADGSQEEYVPCGDAVRLIHSQRMERNGKEYELNLASNTISMELRKVTKLIWRFELILNYTT